MITGAKSARITAPYQTEAFASTVTSPISTAVGAIHASGCTTGLLPSNENSGTAQTLPVQGLSAPLAVDRKRTAGAEPMSRMQPAICRRLTRVAMPLARYAVAAAIVIVGALA